MESSGMTHRTPAEIQAEIDHLRGEGKHHLCAEIKALRAELYEADPSLKPAPKPKKAKKRKASAPRGDYDGDQDRALYAEIEELRRENRELKAQLDDQSDLDCSTEGGDYDAWCPIEGPSQGYQDSDEWQFIERCCARLDVDLTKGVTSNLAKKVYQQLWAKLVTWRMVREIVLEYGPGSEWPQYADTGRNPNTGKKDPKYDPERIKAEQEARRAERQRLPAADGVTEGGMPFEAGRPRRDEIIAQVMGGAPLPTGNF